MNKREKFPESPFSESEQPTGSRYSLADEKRSVEDFFFSHPSGKIRMIRYPNPNVQKTGIRDDMINQGLILGRKHDSGSSNEQLFIVPTSARPLEYEASSSSEGEFSYNDDELLYELGMLLSELKDLESGSCFFGGNIGKSVALVEFTSPGERKLKFVPGSELMTEKLTEGFDELDFYLKNISGTLNFSTRHLTPFKEGFSRERLKE